MTTATATTATATATAASYNGIFCDTKNSKFFTTLYRGLLA